MGMATEATVDIKTRFIRDDGKVFFVFPGNGYRHYAWMKEHSAVYLDLPGFPIPDDQNIAALDDLVERIAVSDDIVEWHRKGMPADAIPDRDPATIGARRRSKRRAFLGGVLHGFFAGIKKGDVVIVPPKDFNDDVLFGEFIDEGDVCTSIPAPFQTGEKIPARRVRWLARQKRMAVPGWLERKLPSPNPVRQLERPLHKYVYDILYERYYFDGQFVCKFAIDSTDFSTLDNFLVQQIFLYASALFENNQEENITDISEKSLLAVVSEIEFSEDIPDQRIVIQSPGNIVLYSKNIIPLVAGVLMALSAACAGGDAPTKVKIVNSADGSQISLSCVLDIEHEVEADMELMGTKRWVEWCKAEVEARKRTNIRPGMGTEISSQTGQTSPLKSGSAP